MKITVLGSGTMMPTKERHPSSYLVEEEETRVLLDCGHTTVSRLVDRDIDLHSIDAIALTHFHTDHIADLLPLVHARFVDCRLLQREHQPLTIVGPETLEERFRKLREVMWPEPREMTNLTFREVQGGESLTVGSLELTAFAVTHVPWFKSLGYRVSDGKKSFAYTGDLGSNQDFEALEMMIRGVDLLIIEAGALESSNTHFTPQQALELATRCSIPRVFLTHIFAGREAGIRAVAEQHAEVLCLAEDGMELIL